MALAYVAYDFGGNNVNNQFATVSGADCAIRIIQSYQGIRKAIRSIMASARSSPAAVWGAHSAQDVIVVKIKITPNTTGGDAYLAFAGIVHDVLTGALNIDQITKQGGKVMWYGSVYIFTWQELTFDEMSMTCEDGESFFIGINGPFDRDTGASLAGLQFLAVNGDTITKGEQQKYKLR